MDGLGVYRKTGGRERCCFWGRGLLKRGTRARGFVGDVEKIGQQVRRMRLLQVSFDFEYYNDRMFIFRN